MKKDYLIYFRSRAKETSSFNMEVSLKCKDYDDISDKKIDTDICQ